MTTPHFATVPGVVPIVQVGIGDVRPPETNMGRWDLSHWDSTDDAHWSGVEPVWVDITCHVQAVQSHVGTDRILDAWDVGTCTVTVDNSTGWADLTVDPLDPDSLSLRPGRQIRWGILDTETGVTTWRFRGFIDSESATYAGQRAESDATILECIDALGEVGRARLTRLAAPVGDGETVTARLNRILNTVGWRPEWRNLAVSNIAVIATDLDAQASDLLTATSDSAGGSIFGDYNGHITFRGRDWQAWIDGTPADLEVGNTPGAVCPTSVDVAFGRAGTTTRGMTNWDGSDTGPHIFDDTAAQVLYGVETTPERLDLQTSDPLQLDQLARRLVETRGVATMPRVNTLNLDAGRDRETMLACLDADPQRPSRWHLVIDRDGRSVLDRQLFVTAVDHDWDAAGWRCQVTLDDAAPWIATVGRWDGAYWDSALWSAA